MAKYSQEFKLEVVQYYLSGFGRHQVSHKFGIHHSDVAKWVANYNNHGAEGLSRKNTNTVYTPESLYTTNFTEPLSYQGSAFLKLPKFP
ncbi:helix-turn-helix domain-containing protein [Acinetobacter baumannii]|nr:helix-turn-helix domain-containing protein [Acinetobacter baumannii]